MRSFRKPAFILILILLGLTARAQEQKMDLRGAPRSLTELFPFLQSKYGYRFFYNNEVVRPEMIVILDSDRYDLPDLLSELSNKTGLTFSVKENKLVVVEDNRRQPDFSGRIGGTVRDPKTEEVLPGVNIIVSGTQNGVATDAGGRFTLEGVGRGDTLSVSCIGYVPQKVPVDGKVKFDIFLTPESKKIDEVVVTALNVNRTKSSLGYSISTVDGEELEKARENNVINNLAGRVAGLQVTKSSTGVDGSTRVILRGVSSINGENRPLIVVDGIPVDASHGGGGRWGGTDNGDALSDINPADVESMSILKGAGAAAAYGSRGANGVILITTKKGALRKGLGVTFDSNMSLDTPLLWPDLQNEYGHGAFGTYPASLPDPGMPWAWSYGPKMEGQILPNFWGGNSPFIPQPNNYKDFFRSGSSIVNTLALESGSETASVRASVTTQNSNGIVPVNGLNRQTINLRGYARLKEIIELDARVTYIHAKTFGRPDVAEGANNPGYFLSIMPRNMVDRELIDHARGQNGNELLWTTDSYTANPFWQMENNVNQDEKNRMQGVFSTKIHFTPVIDLLLRSGLDLTDRTSLSHVAKGSVANNFNGRIYNSQGDEMEWNSDFLLSYHPALKNDFQYSVSLGGNYRYNRNQGLSQWGSNLKINDFYAISNAGTYGTDQWFSQKEVFSLYGLSTLSFRNWLYFDFTLRNDWSSTLPIQNNSYMYHSENLSFLFTKALGLRSGILTSGKVRASFSRVGNDTGPYQTSRYYSVYQSMLPYPTGGFSDVLATYDLQPEITGSWEVGTNLDFLGGAIILDATFYRNHSENQIMDVPLPPSSGYNSKRMNAAELRNTGVEIQLDVMPVQQEDFSWHITGTWSKNQSLVVSLANNLESIILDDAWHATIQARPGEEYGGIYTYDFKRDAFGHKLVDDDGYVMKGDYRLVGNMNPDWLAGLSNTFNYKNLSLSFLVDFRMGGDVYSMGKAYRTLFGTSEESLAGRDDWYATHDPTYGYSTPLPGVVEKGYVEDAINGNTGKQNSVPVDPIYRYYNVWAKEIGVENVVDATNIRMREVSFGYTLPGKWVSRLPLTGVQISFYGRNLFFFYNAMNDIDPESGYSSGNTGGGFEHCAIPTTRSIGFNLKVTF
jgi:TonB-linked SusC/RagA family outer membrane protein